MARVIHSAGINENRTRDSIFMVILGGFMLIIPFYRGLFFRDDYLQAITFIGVIFLAFMAFRFKDKTSSILGTYIDISVLLLPMVYLIAFFFAVNAKDAFDMFLLYCSYFMLYKLVSELSIKNERFKDLFINVVILSAFILSFTSMLSISGIIDLLAAFDDRRLYGLYQYPNTTASVLGVGIVLSLNKLINEENIKLKAVYQGVLTTLLPAFIFTLSRGGYLVLAGVLLLNFLLIKARAKVKMLLGLAISFLSLVFFIYKYYTLPNGELGVIWIYYLISMLASAILIYAVYLLNKQIKLNFSDRTVNITLAATVAIFVGMSSFLLLAKEPIEYRVEHQASDESYYISQSTNLYGLEPNTKYTVEFDVMSSTENPNSYGIMIFSTNKVEKTTEIFRHFEQTGQDFTRMSLDFKTLEDSRTVQIHFTNYESGSYTVYKNVVIKDSSGKIVHKVERLKYLPQAIGERLADISFRTVNVSYRLYYTQDGLKIIKDYPLIGAGGGAWENLYKQYQIIPYNTTEVHNFYVQYGIEVGIIGIAVLIGLLILLVISMIKSIKNGSHYVYVYLAAMLLLLHSSIDFNLSLPAVAYILWLLIGLINSDKNTALRSKLSHKYVGAFALVFTITVLLFSASARYGMRLGAEGAVVSEENIDTNRAIELYERAVAFDRYNGINRIDLAQLLNSQLRKTKDNNYYNGVMEQISLIRKYEPYNHQYTPTICNILLSLGKFEEASKLADSKVVDEPVWAQSYDVKISVNFEIASYYARNNNMQSAIPYLEKIADAKEQLAKANEVLATPLVLSKNAIEKVEASIKALEVVKSGTNK